ncbi:site-specific DNA-methyltransferase [Luteitalea sp.]|uniref:site-specific DNA-methyltransferase n=1 Tax=Luteitalea sp. TaxID=2004800 RepID=UPI0025BD6674|nr:site-specific DNA-methyltransferase [Luteitalea sp.]
MVKKVKAPKPPTHVEAIKHKDTRKNIPTEELRDFVAADERAPKEMLYPRDPSLDPQLVWKGKDEQDRADLAVPVVPVYIQEKVHPQAIIEHLRTTAKAGEKEPELSLFDDFNGLDGFDKKVDFYKWDQHWSNRMILGDSLLVMTSLAEKEALKGKVQMIYLDPPYGIKFGSNWQVSTRKRDVKDGKVEDATRQPEQIRAFRDTWKLGIHSYLAYLRDRLTVARDLLTETGSIFVQIGDENVHLVRNVMDEVFGSENFVSQVTYSKTSGATVVLLPGTSDYLIWYAKSIDRVKFRRLYKAKEFGGEGASKYDQLELRDGSRRALAQGESLPAGSRVFRLDNLMSQSMGREKGEGAASWFPVAIEGKEYRPNDRSRWKTNEAGMAKLLMSRRVEVTGRTLAYVRFLDDFSAYPLSNTWTDIGGIQSRTDPKVYVVQTATTAIERCMLMTSDPGDLVLDPTCGSGTTAYVAEQWGRRWITCDTSRVALTLTRTRLMAGRFPWYLLADSPEGQKKEAELTGKMAPSYKTDGDIRKGFVYKRVPHVTLKSIANNPDITEGMTRSEIDAAILRHADTELLYDKPYEDNKRIRVTGPFTVESLSPHRVLPADDDRPRSEQVAQRDDAAGQFETMILDNLRKAGVQNTVKGERLVFDRLEALAGTWLHAAGAYTDADGKVRRVAVSIGPEHGTVGPRQVKEAAKEAVLGVGYDVLVVCGFAFDPHVSEEAKRYGALQVLTARMNPDLSMGDELLKKTGAGNLFMVFGEPDVDIAPVDVAGNLQVTLKGVDVYDPTTGQVRSNSTDDVACWFIDTNYDGESFFVRHAYFTGADEPYEKLKRALRAEIDEAAWSTLYSTVSRPFAPPETGRIAVKVINHYGDEVLKVFTLA